MSEISPLNYSAGSVQSLGDRRIVADATATPASTRTGDSVEVSKSAQLLANLASLPDVRQDLVDRVRGEIAAGTYETDDKLDQAVTSLLSDL
jgi:negative regulator of flagellin synthesis FlgM